MFTNARCHSLLFGCSILASLLCAGVSNAQTPPPAPVVEPLIAVSYPNDDNGDRIDDALLLRAQGAALAVATAATPESRLVAQERLNEPVAVELIFLEPVTQNQINQFLALSGEVDYMYKAVSYGWNGRIPLRSVPALSASMGDSLVLVEEPVLVVQHLNKATQTGRVRPIWASGFAGSASGYDGGGDITIGIVDSGIDDSHPDLAGRGLYWQDFTSEAYASPTDINQHGSHVAGIALGAGTSHGNATATLRYTQYGDLKGVSGFFPSPVDAPETTITLAHVAEWTGGGSTTFGSVYRTLGVIGWNYLSSPVSGDSPQTESNTFTGSSARVYSPLLLGAGNATVSEFYVRSTMTNFPGIGDGFNTFSGVAPGASWAGAKVLEADNTGTSSWFDAAIDDVVAVRIDHNIKVMNMSLGMFGSPGLSVSTRQKVNTAVNNGIVVVISAGNDGNESTQSARQVDDPGRAAMALTLASSNDVNALTHYTSEGFANPGSSFGQEEDFKPDLMAPGGSLSYYTGIMSVDSNDGDGTAFADQQADDYYNIQGTSMAAPFAAGAAALLIDALQTDGGVTWDFASSTHSRYVKMLLCATATESNAIREDNKNNPTLQRAAGGPIGFPAGKDPFEGFGMINPDAAIEAALLTYALGDTLNETLGSGVNDRRASARTVELLDGVTFEADLAVPSTGDYDLYLFDSAPSGYGTPVMLDSSTNAGNDTDESISYTPGADMNAIIVIKRVSGSGAFSLTSTAAVPAIDAIPDHSVANGASYSRTPSLSGGTPPITWTLTSPASPPGDMAIDSGTGEVTWTANVANTPVNITIQATNSVGSDTESWTLTVLETPPIINSIANESVSDGASYGRTPTLSQGTGTIAWSLTSPASPPGDMQIDSGTGEVSWTANYADTPVDITVQASNNGGSDTEDWTLTVNALTPVINVIGDASPNDGAAYSQTPTLSQGSGTITWSLIAPASPPGDMQINSSTGQVTWTADYDETPVDVTIQASGPGGNDTESWTINVQPLAPVIDAINDASPNDGAAYSQTPTLSQGSGTITWSLTAPASPPSDMQINSSTGQVTWTADYDETPVNVTIQASGPGGNDTESWTINVQALAPVIDAIGDATPDDGAAYSQTPALSQGSGTIMWSLIAPASPPGDMQINSSTGQVRWTADYNDTPVNVTIEAEGPGGTDTESWTINVQPLAPVINAIGDASPNDGAAYSQTPTLSQGSGTITWSLIAPASPPGDMQINSTTSEVSWTADYDDTPVDVTIQASGPGGNDTESWTINVQPLAPVIDAIDDATPNDGAAYSQTPTLSQGSGTITWSLTSPASPPGDMQIDSNTGQATWTADYADSPVNVTIEASGPGGTDTESWTITVNALQPAIDAIDDVQLNDGVAYSETPSLSQGTGPITWSLTAPAVPPGDMAIDPSTGEVTWTADLAASPVNVTIEASGPGSTDTESWMITVQATAPVIEAIENAAVNDGDAYTELPALSQGTGPITWGLTAPAVPRGDMAIDPGTGEVTWTAVYGDSPVDVTIEASGPGGTDTESWTINVQALAPVIGAIDDASPQDGSSYSESPVLTQGTGSITWSLTAPAVPPGDMAIDSSTGEVTWTADYDDTPVGVTVQASGPGGDDTESWTVFVQALPPVISPIDDATINAGTAYSVSPVLLQGSGFTFWTIEIPASPPGNMQIDSTTGELTWTATADVNPLAITIQASGPGGSDVETWTLTVTDVVWVDFGAANGGSGTFASPYNTLVDALAAANAGATIVIRGDSSVTESAETPTIAQEVRLVASNGSVQIGATPLPRDDSAFDTTDAQTGIADGSGDGGGSAVGAAGGSDALAGVQTSDAQAVAEALAGLRPYEPAMPYVVNAEGHRTIRSQAPAAIRLLSVEPLNPATIWGEVPAALEGRVVVEWFSHDTELRDVWVVFRPIEDWNPGEIVLRAGGIAADGSITSSDAVSFRLGATRKVAAATAVRIDPAEAFVTPKPLVLPEAGGQLWYYLGHGPLQGWHPAETVLGLLAGPVEVGPGGITATVTHGGLVLVE